METLRTFVAIDVGVEAELRNKWYELKNHLRSESIKWVDENSLHLTLFFLGETPVESIDKISDKLESELLKVNAFHISLQGFGAFGNASSPRVIWAGIANSKPLANIKKIISDSVSPFGFKEQSSAFSPHFTLGRVRHMHSSTELVGFMNRNKSSVLQEAEVDKVIFYQSILTPSVPIYKPLKVFKLPSL